MKEVCIPQLALDEKTPHTKYNNTIKNKNW